MMKGHVGGDARRDGQTPGWQIETILGRGEDARMAERRDRSLAAANRGRELEKVHTQKFSSGFTAEGHDQ